MSLLIFCLLIQTTFISPQTLNIDPTLVSKQDYDDFAAKQYPNTEQLKPEYDFVVVGAGTAGCTLANRLSENGNWSVLLIEAGDVETRLMDIPALDAVTRGTYTDWQYQSQPSTKWGFGMNDHKIKYPRGKLMGGSSILNGMIYTRGSPRDYDDWDFKYLNPGWSYNNVKKYFNKLEHYHPHDDDGEENSLGRNGPLDIENPPYHTQFSSSLLKAAQENGYRVVDYDSRDVVGVSRVQATIYQGFRVSSNAAYMVPISSSRPNLDLKRNCTVTKINIQGYQPFLKATAVELTCNSNQSLTVKIKKEVIVSGGTINSPQLLMLSGIGPRNHLRELNIPVLMNLPVGDNFLEHYHGIGMEFILNQTVVPDNQDEIYRTNKSGPLSLPGGNCEVLSLILPNREGQPQIEQQFFTKSWIKSNYQGVGIMESIYNDTYKQYVENNPIISAIPILLKPKSRGYLRLKSANPNDKPLIYPNYFSHPDDLENIVAGMKEILKVSQQPALQKYNATLVPKPISNCAKHTFLSDNYFRCQVKTMFNTLYHHSGTCKMGPIFDRSSVVNHQLKVHGTQNIRVVDASIMPEIISGHVNGPIFMIAEKGADLIKQSWK